jgi:hypothetical protein
MGLLKFNALVAQWLEQSAKPVKAGWAHQGETLG